MLGFEVTFMFILVTLQKFSKTFINNFLKSHPFLLYWSIGQLAHSQARHSLRLHSGIMRTKGIVDAERVEF